MNRHAFALKINENDMNAFRTALGQNWDSIRSLLDTIRAENFSLWGIEDLVFGYYETETASGDSNIEDNQRGDIEENPHSDIEDDLRRKAFRQYEAILDATKGLYEWISAPDTEMRLMYEDFGIVRKDKSLIRHRVFATKLRGPFQEEYSRRHKALMDSREGRITRGPDSNFSIWNAGEYIFGYDEIDTTMEEEETEESRAASLAWETRMLEIMEWYTDDVDWITGLRHQHIRRLAWYK